jgi:hypothetical protein
MTYANPACGAQSEYLRGGTIFAVDFLGGSGDTGEGQIILRRVIWLCDACSGKFTVETWRPPAEQVRPSGSARMQFPRARGQGSQAQNWS